MYQRILVPIDGSATAAQGLGEAIELARLTGGTIRLLHVVDELAFAFGAGSYAPGSVDVFDRLREGGQGLLDEAKARVAQAGVTVETCLHDNFEGRVCDIVADTARTWPADLIVVGTHGRRGIGRLVIGSDAEQILRCAPVPVLLVRAAAAHAGA